MASESIAIGRVDAPARRLTETLHEWVTTVDHKKLGIMYILYALLFLVIGGIEATIMRIQLIVPHNNFVSPQVFNQMFTMHGTTMIFFVAMPIMFGFGNYLVPLMIGARDMAFPRLNAFSFWLAAFGGMLLYFSFIGGIRAIRGRPSSGRWLVRLCPAHFARILYRAQHGFLDAGVASLWHWQYRDCGKFCGYDFVLALSGYDAEQNAAVCVDESGNGGVGAPGDIAFDRRPNHALPGSLSRRALF